MLTIRPNEQASTLAITSSLSHLAVGLADGTVILLRHLDQVVSTTPVSSLPAGLPKMKIVHTSADPVTGLGFHIASEANTPADKFRLTTLFIVTISKVLSYPVGQKLANTAPSVMDDIGASLNCSTMNNEGALIVARDEAVYVYGHEGREACVAYEGRRRHCLTHSTELTGTVGPKSSIFSHSSYVIMVSPPFMPSVASFNPAVREFASRTTSSADIAQITLFDLSLNIVAHISTFEESIKTIFCEYGEIYALTTDGKLYRFEEKSSAAKLDSLFSKGYYQLALSLSKTSGLDEADIANIRQR